MLSINQIFTQTYFFLLQIYFSPKILIENKPTMMMSSSLVRAGRANSSRAVFMSKISSCNNISNNTNRCRGFATRAAYRGVTKNSSSVTLGLAAAAALSAAVATTSCDKKPPLLSSIPLGTGITNKVTEEKSTGIAFLDMVNGMKLVGVGVRIKYIVIKVYAVGTYMDPVAMEVVKKRPAKEIAGALLDPKYPRVIRIVLARKLTSDEFTDALLKELKPRLGSVDEWALDDFRKMMPTAALPEGSEFLLTIRGDSLLFQNPSGSFGNINSHAFCKALCDVYFGNDPVSPSHKKAVLEGITKL